MNGKTWFLRKVLHIWTISKKWDLLEKLFYPNVRWEIYDFIQFKLLKHKHAKAVETCTPQINCWVEITSILQDKKRPEGVQGECSGWQENSGGIRTFTKIPEDLSCLHGRVIGTWGYNFKSRTRTSGWKLCGVTFCFNTGMPNPPFWNAQKWNLLILPGNLFVSWEVP